MSDDFKFTKKMAKFHYQLLWKFVSSSCIQSLDWTRLVDYYWTTGLPSFFLVFKYGRLDSVEWNGGLEWNGEMERYFGNFNWW